MIRANDGRLAGMIDPAAVTAIMVAPEGIGSLLVVSGCAPMMTRISPDDLADQLFGGADDADNAPG